MATVSSSDPDVTPSHETGYLDVFLRPFRMRWVKIFFGFEVVLVVVGYLLNALWGSPTGVGEHPDVHMALGVVLGALAVVFALIFLVVYLLLVGLELRDRGIRQVEF